MSNIDQNVGNKGRSEGKNFPESIFYIAECMKLLFFPQEQVAGKIQPPLELLVKTHLEEQVFWEHRSLACRRTGSVFRIYP